jgi:hypothetical protein
MSTVAKKVIMGSGAVDVPLDDKFNTVSFLSHFDGANSGYNNAFDDSSASNHTITAHGSVTQGSFAPFARPDGEWSMYNGVNVDANYLSAADSDDWAFGSGNYTVEAFVYATSVGSFNKIVGQWTHNGAGSTNAWVLESVGAALDFYAIIGSSAVKLAEAGSDLPLNEWVHVAVVRNGNNHTLYQNGVGGSTVSNSSAYDAASGALEIGSFSSLSGGSWDGYISQVRIVKGTAVYTSNFTPPTAPLTAISGTVLLTCQSNLFIDNSASAHAITASGTPKVTPYGPILTSAAYTPASKGASAFFDTTSTYLSAADSSDFTLGNTFTIEAWIYPTVLNAYNTVVEQNGGSGFYYSALSNGKMEFYKGIGGVAYNNSDAVLIKNQWNHVAYVVSSGTGYHYVNGNRSGSSASIDMGDISAVLKVGLQGSSWPYTGYMSDVRIVVGSAVYSGTTYTIPTAPLTAITNTKLLLNMADGQAIDSAAQNNMMLYGNADTSTNQQKFGTASLALDGSGDYLTFPANTTNDFGISNFTIECWVYVADASSYNCIISVGDPIQFYVNNNTLECYVRPLVGVSNCLGPSSSISNNTWCHVALVRNGTALNAYVNGVSGTTFSGSTATITAFSGNAAIGIYSPSSGLPFSGYIDDFRISRFARYTSNFTPTTEAFPDQGQ